MTTATSAKNSEVTYRPWTDADILAVAAIHRASFDDMANRFNMPNIINLHTPEEDLDHFSHKMANGTTVLVAEQNGKVIGYCAYKDGWLEDLYILPALQAKGIGSTLLVKAQQANQALQLWAFQKNTEAQKFYLKHGFTLIKRTDGQANDEKEPDALFGWAKN